MKNNNPHNLCTWDSNSDCSSCKSNSKLHCKWSGKILYGFLAIGFPPFIMTIFLTVVIGLLNHHWYWLIGYLVYVTIIFTYEIRFLCSHCPYYGEEGKTLHCLGNYGAYKLYKYNPAPIGKFEKFMMLFLVSTVFFIFPLFAGISGIVYIALFNYNLITLMGFIGITLACLMSSITFVVILKLYYCSKCINFFMCIKHRSQKQC